MTERADVRPGPGGPRLIATQIRLTEGELAALRTYAREREMSVAAVVRQMVRDLLLDD